MSDWRQEREQAAARRFAHETNTLYVEGWGAPQRRRTARILAVADDAVPVVPRDVADQLAATLARVWPVIGSNLLWEEVGDALAAYWEAVGE